jgi:hypothetical protein
MNPKPVCLVFHLSSFIPHPSAAPASWSADPVMEAMPQGACFKSLDLQKPDRLIETPTRTRGPSKCCCAFYVQLVSFYSAAGASAKIVKGPCLILDNQSRCINHEAVRTMTV